eukprot:749516_1
MSTMQNSWFSTRAALTFLLGFVANMMIARFDNSISMVKRAMLSTDENDQEITKDGWGQVNVYYGEELAKVPGKWYGQALQDKEVMEILGYKRNGYFIDLAACVPGWSSNTLALEHDYDWKGLAMDADHSVWYDLSRRNCDVVGVVV